MIDTKAIRAAAEFTKNNTPWMFSVVETDVLIAMLDRLESAEKALAEPPSKQTVLRCVLHTQPLPKRLGCRMTNMASSETKVVSQLATYTLHLTEYQAVTISHACEVLARLGMGQFKDALECLPLKEFAPDGWREDMEGIAHILKKHTTIMNGVGAYHSIGSHKTSDKSKTAWDLYQVVRHRLAWDANPEGNPMSVMYDTPMQTSKEPLAWME